MTVAITNPSPPVDNTVQIDKLDLSKSRAAKKQHDTYVTWTLDQFTKMKNARVVIERQWYLNLAFMFGRQHVAFVRPGTQGFTSPTKLWVPPAPYWRARPVFNRIRPTIRTEIAQLTNNKPNATVVPASSEDRDVYAAMASEQIWESIYVTKKLKAHIRRAMWWNQVCGNGYIKTWWDFNYKTSGDSVGDPNNNGDVCFSHETPFHVFIPDLLEEEIEQQPFLIHASMRSPEYVKMRFKTGIDGEEIKTVETSGREILEETFLNLIGGSQIQKQRSIIELEVWVKPGCDSRFPDGAMFTIIGNKIVQGYGGLPYSHGQYPFAKFDHIPAGKYYSTSSIEDLIPLQKEYNRTHGQIIENKNRMGKLQFMGESGAVDPTKMTSEPGQYIPYTPGFNKPEIIPVPNLPSFITDTLDRILQDWNDISGQHEVTHGQVPPGVTAATAISYLQERDETKLSPTFDSLEEGIEKVAKQTLVLIQNYMNDDRKFKIGGPDGYFDVMTFNSSDLANNLDIRVEAGSALPVSKAAKQAFVMDLMKLGFIDPQDGLSVLDMGGITKIYEKVQEDRRQVQRENLRMAKVTPQMQMAYDQQNQAILAQDPNHFGTQPVLNPSGAPITDPATGQPQQAPLDPPPLIGVNSYDNHKLHILYHNSYRKGQAFEALPDNVKQLFEDHVNMHIKAMGVETETMQPRVAAGLPPVDQSQQQQGAPSGQQPPGPQPMPQLTGSQ